MNKDIENKAIRILAIDLSKRSYQLHGVNSQGQLVLAKAVTRSGLQKLLATLPACLVAMEACGGAHFWGRLCHQYGHTVRLIAPQFVKPFVKSNKNDAHDAEAISEAVQRPNMRFVAVKSVAQQDIQALHRMRQLLIEHRTAQVNQLRGLLGEYGIDIPVGRHHVRRQLPEILEDGENGLGYRFRDALSLMYDELVHLDNAIAWHDEQIEQIAQSDEAARRLQTIPGIGPKTATALLAAIGDISAFRNGRELAAWLGLVPRQHSTGGRAKLLGISKRGDVYLRTLLIHGARAVQRTVARKTDRTSRWVAALAHRRHKNVAAVALANKMARTVYALLKYGDVYRDNPALSHG